MIHLLYQISEEIGPGSSPSIRTIPIIGKEKLDKLILEWEQDHSTGSYTKIPKGDQETPIIGAKVLSQYMSSGCWLHSLELETTELH